MSEVIGIVLAAGAGRRMGGPKALIGPLAEDGRTPLARVCTWVHEGGCERVIAVIGAQAGAVRAALAVDPGWTAVPDVTPAGSKAPRSWPDWLTVVEASGWAEGMGASLRTALEAATVTPATVALITLVDLPDVRGPVYTRVLGAAPGRSSDAAGDVATLGHPAHGTPVDPAPELEPRPGASTLARASYDGRPGHPVLIGRDHWPAVTAAAKGDQGARSLFAATPHDLIECGDLASGRDADTGVAAC